MTNAKSPQKRTTGIGSLPHHNLDAALEFSFQMGLPFLPQIPIRNPWEYMIAQALEGLPGLRAESDGTVSLNLDVWESRTADFSRRLETAFKKPSSDFDAFEEFEPSPATSSSWQAFVWEISEREIRRAKTQIAGPMTSQWALRLRDGSQIDQHPDLTSQILRLVLARALAMTRKLRSEGATPVIYLDEPGLYGLSPTNPKHLIAIQELRLMIQTLRKEGAEVGLHCCSNTNWEVILGLGLDWLSIDTALSLESLLESEKNGHFSRFIQQGGKLSLGVIPTARSSFLHSLKIEDLHAETLDTLARGLGGDLPKAKKILGGAMLSPACGLAYHTVSDAELVLEILGEFESYSDHACKS